MKNLFKNKWFWIVLVVVLAIGSYVWWNSMRMKKARALYQQTYNGFINRTHDKAWIKLNEEKAISKGISYEAQAALTAAWVVKQELGIDI